MSLIFQTLHKLDAVPDNGPGLSTENGDRRFKPAPLGKSPQRMFWMAGIMGGVLVLMGFSALFAVRFVASHAGRSEAQVPGLKHNSVAESSQPDVPIASVAQALPEPDVTIAGANSEPPRVIERSGAGHVKTDSDVNSTTPARPERLSDAAPDVPMQAARTPSEALDPMTAEQHQAERAQRAALEKSERIQRVVAQLETALSISPGNSGAIEALLAELTRIKEPNSPYVARMRAYWLLKQGDNEQAKAILEKAAAIDADDEQVGINLAIIDLRTGNGPGALARLKQLAKAHPDNTQIADLIRKLR